MQKMRQTGENKMDNFEFWNKKYFYGFQVSKQILEIQQLACVNSPIQLTITTNMETYEVPGLLNSYHPQIQRGGGGS